MLWFYSAITGLSPSVLRASTMFSFIIIAQSFKRYTNIYNTLAASAFLLLVIDPYIIMQVGFQLSYLAVIGIVYLQPKIQEWFSFDNWLLNQIWTITAVSIAAQVATFPLGLLYFHQFPNYFLLSNLLVIPISTIIIYLGIAVFAFAKVSVVVSYLALGFSWSVWLLNASVIWIEQLPFSLLQGISISILETWLLYGLIILFVFYLSNRKYTNLKFAFVTLILVLVSQVYEQYQQFHQKKIIIYNIPKTSAIDFVSAKSNVLLTDTSFAKNESRLLFHVKHNWWDLGLNMNQIVSSNFKNEVLKIEQQWIQFYDKKMIVLTDKTELSGVKPINIDYLLISHSPKLKVKEILKTVNCKQLIFDSSNSLTKINAWKKECLAIHQPFYDVTESGAFELEL
jgi:competence protein ComEC